MQHGQQNIKITVFIRHARQQQQQQQQKAENIVQNFIGTNGILL
jgi:hypothetical protein